MNAKMIDIYEKCMKHNISISIKYLLSDAAIEVEGYTLVYVKETGKYETIKCSKWVFINELKNINHSVDLISSAVERVFATIIVRKGEMDNE